MTGEMVHCYYWRDLFSSLTGPGTGAEGGLVLHSSDGQLRQAQADNLIDNFSNTCKQGVQAQDKCYQPFFSVFALIVFAIQNPDCNDRNQS